MSTVKINLGEYEFSGDLELRYLDALFNSNKYGEGHSRTIMFKKNEEYDAERCSFTFIITQLVNSYLDFKESGYKVIIQMSSVNSYYLHLLENDTIISSKIGIFDKEITFNDQIEKLTKTLNEVLFDKF